MERDKGKSRKADRFSIEDTAIARLRLARGKGAAGFDPYQGAWLEAKRRAEELKREAD